MSAFRTIVIALALVASTHHVVHGQASSSEPQQAPSEVSGGAPDTGQAPSSEEFTPEDSPLNEGGASSNAGPPAESTPAEDAATEGTEGKSGLFGLVDPMSSFGVSLRVGGSFQGRRTYTFEDNSYVYNPIYFASGPGSNGLLAVLGLHFGDGHGFGVDGNLELRRYKHDDGTSYGDFALAPIFGYRFQVFEPLYLFAGLGPRLGLGWTGVDGANKKGLVGVRLPLQANFYFTNWVAALVEFGVGYDVLFSSTVDSLNSSYFYTERGYTFDLSVGVRFL